jgi:hypothetical protein
MFAFTKLNVTRIVGFIDKYRYIKTNLFIVNLLKPSGFFTYHHVQHSKFLHGARFALSVLNVSQNRQRLLLHAAQTDWFLIVVGLLTVVVLFVYCVILCVSLLPHVYCFTMCVLLSYIL